MNRRALLQGSVALASLATLSYSAKAWFPHGSSAGGSTTGHAMVELFNYDHGSAFAFMNNAKMADSVWIDKYTSDPDPYSYLDDNGWPTKLGTGSSGYSNTKGLYFAPGDIWVLVFSGDPAGSAYQVQLGGLPNGIINDPSFNGGYPLTIGVGRVEYKFILDSSTAWLG